MAETIIESPLGQLFVATSSRGVRQVSFVGYDDKQVAPDDSATAKELLQATRQQINEYFEGRRRDFDLPLDLKGSEFRKRVWQAIAAIPFGLTISYGQVAVDAGSPGAYRAAGSACGANQVVLLVPCHRVIGSDGSLHGYGAGLDRKAWLLAHEGVPGMVAPALMSFHREPVAV